ncbi:MAG: SCO family protein [Desulfuromonadales bacterium]
MRGSIPSNLLLFFSIILGIFHCDLSHAGTQYKRTIENYSMPDVVLVNQNGAKVRFKELMQSNKPIIVDFIFGTCTTICPVLSAGFVNLQNKIGSDSKKVHLVSISIDPENDTPMVMNEYLKRYKAKPGWDFLTGSRKDIDTVMKAFNAYIPNKMSHYPLTLMRPSGDNKWIRIFGLMSSLEFISEYQKMANK